MTETTTVPSTASDGAGEAARTIEVENPATGHVIATVSVVAPGDVAGLVERARRAQLGWDPEVDFTQLVHLLVEADLERLRAQQPATSMERQ